MDRQKIDIWIDGQMDRWIDGQIDNMDRDGQRWIEMDRQIEMDRDGQRWIEMDRQLGDIVVPGWFSFDIQLHEPELKSLKHVHMCTKGRRKKKFSFQFLQKLRIETQIKIFLHLSFCLFEIETKIQIILTLFLSFPLRSSVMQNSL